MNIGLIGYTDKRPLIYGLFKLLQHTGDVIFISDDRRLLRLSDTHETLGHFQNIMLCITDASPDEVWESIEHSPDDFTHVMYDLKSFLPADKLDICYVCKTCAYENGEEDFLSLIDNANVIKFMYDNKPDKDKTARNISISSDLIRACEQIEAYKVLPPCNSKEVINILETDFSIPLELDARAIKKLLLGGWKE